MKMDDAKQSMKKESLTVNRSSVRIIADPSRVIARPFAPGEGNRLRAIINRIMDLSESEVFRLLSQVLEDFSSRHKNIKDIFNRHYDLVSHHINGQWPISNERRWLIGSYFTNEYSLESVAMFNPSMVLHPDQSGMQDGEVRFIMSLRACGEGHISSIEFRSGMIDTSNSVSLDPVPRYAMTGNPVDDKLYNKPRFFRKLIEIGAYNPLADGVFDLLDDRFTVDDLRGAIDQARPTDGYADTYLELCDHMMWVAHSNYQLSFSEDTDISERVIFPVSENESRGIEDARFVRFVDDDGSVIYYATYTAYNGYRTLPQFLETTDFLNFKIYTLSGQCVQNKGMAMFPRKIDGWYWTVSRLDGENIFLLRSDNLHFWDESHKLRGPVQPWEFVQIGNCGSPIETKDGWLLLTHGVGPMRQYWLGAILLDMKDPTKVIGQLDEPMLIPNETERDGYVPNVVYSCGAMVHQNDLIIPYAVADSSTSIATVSLPELLSHLKKS